MKILLLTPPFTQLNTPFPATMYLKAFLSKQGHEVMQADMGIELFCRIYASDNLKKMFAQALGQGGGNFSHDISTMLAEKERYAGCVDAVVRFLQGNDPTLAVRICHTDFLPMGHRQKTMNDDGWAFGTVGITEKARHMSTLFISEIADFIKECICSNFDLGRYAESLCIRVPFFSAIDDVLNQKPSFIDLMIHQLVREKMDLFQPQLVGFSIPFPGNLLGALQAGICIRNEYPDTIIAWGGGYPGTELRSIKSSKVFDYTDFIVLDDGEPALIALTQHIESGRLNNSLLHNTFFRNNKGDVQWSAAREELHIPFNEIPAPDYSDLHLHLYISAIEVSNPMHKLWSDGRWNKMMLARGCYWAKCAFCDTSLPYIGCYETAHVATLCNHIESVMAQTSQSGFHFTDEAAPPKILRTLSEEIVRRGLVISWWTNIRFDKSFSPELCALMAQAGCIAVSGGLEVASDRVLKLISKGVSISQASEAAANLAAEGIMVHAYLMYGFPTQTFDETLDGLENVRQMFEKGMLVSAFWHRFAMTIHSPAGINPQKYGAHVIEIPTGDFANNEIPFTDHQCIDFDQLGDGLRMATYNYMLGLGFDKPVDYWFQKHKSTKKKKRHM